MVTFVAHPPEDHRGACRPDPEREPTIQETFQFLDFLRTTGKTNMFGAAPYVEFYLDLPRDVARDYLWKWLHRDELKAQTERLLTMNL